MQRRKYRDYADSVELGVPFSTFVPVNQMRKFAMKRLLKVLVLVIIAYIVYSVYNKMNMAKFTSQQLKTFDDEIDEDVYDMHQNPVKMDKESVLKERDDTKKDIEEIKDLRWKNEVNKVFDDVRRAKEEKDRQNLEKPMKESIQQNILPPRDKEPEIVKQRPIEKVNKVENKLKEESEVEQPNIEKQIDDVARENAEVPKEAIQLEEEREVEAKVEEGGGEIETLGGARVQRQQEDLADEELEKEIEALLADSLKDAANDVADAEEEAKEKRQEQNLPEKKQEDTQESFDKKEFKEAAVHVAERLNPQQIEELRKKMEKLVNPPREDDDHETPPIVTAVSQNTFTKVKNLISSVQSFMPDQKIYVYNLDLLKEQKRQLMTICNVRLRLFMKVLFPNHVSNLENFHWRPLVIQVALAEFGHIIWLNPDRQLKSGKFGRLVHDSHDTGILIIGQPATYSTYAVTNPDMYGFIPTDKEKLIHSTHYEIHGMIIHNTPQLHENFMKLLTACALEEACLAPDGAKTKCTFDFTGRRYANCHRYDESAINLILQNWHDFDTKKYAKGDSYSKKSDERQNPILKFCRDARDIKDHEL